jgi:hypothetical protein
MAGLPRVQKRGRFAHAAGLHHGHEDVQILQLHPASDAIAQLHRVTHHRTVMVASINRIMRA